MDPAFDIGAHVGSITRRLLKRYGAVWAFEPSPAAFDRLADRFAGQGNVRCFRLAFSSASAAGHLTSLSDGKLNRLAAEGDPVEVVTGDEFCLDHGVTSIPYLKIDTEGHDLEVLRGFESTIERQRANFIEVEASMNRRNTRHVPLREFMDYLEPRGYAISQITEQVPERGTNRLRRANVIWTL